MTLTAIVEASPEYERDPHPGYSGDASTFALRAFRAFHPDARIYPVHRNGQSRWLTWKQRQLLRYIDSPHHRNKRLTLRGVAKAIDCHPTTVRRTLMRFHDWGFVTYTALVGRFGGSWVMTIKQKATKWKRRFMDKVSRKVERSWLARQMRKREREMRKPLREWKGLGIQLPLPLSGIMDATLQ